MGNKPKRKTPARKPRGLTVKDRLYALEAFSRQCISDIHLIRIRLEKLEEAPPQERFLRMLSHELAKQMVIPPKPPRQS